MSGSQPGGAASREPFEPLEPFVPGGLQFPLPLSLRDSAQLIGAYRWVEHTLFVLTGSWVQDADDHELRLHLDLVSGEHAWHAELWEDRLPVLDGFDQEALTKPMGPALEAVCAAMPAVLSTIAGEHPEVPLGLLRLAGLYRFFVPRLIVTYDRHLRHAVPATDGPTIRILRMVLRDELESWQAGERLLEGVLRTTKDSRAASTAQARLEEMFVGAGGGLGLVPWPGKGPGPTA